MRKGITYFVSLLVICCSYYPVFAQECNVLSKANDITPDKYCAPVNVDWKITYRGVMDVNKHSDVSFEVDWGDGTLENIPFGVGLGRVNNLSGDDYQAIIQHVYPEALSGACNYQPRVWLRIANHTCSSSVQEQNVTVWDVDNANGGEINIEEQVIYVCVGEDTTVVFRDVSQWNCVPPDEEDHVNNQSRWVQWEYGTGATDLTDVYVDGVAFGGTFAGPVNKVNGPVTNPRMPYSSSNSIYVPPTDVSDIGKVFEVTLNNWNFCNQYPGNDPVSQTARIVVVDIPSVSVKFVNKADSDVCLGAVVKLKGSPSGGVWSSPSGGFKNPNNGSFSSSIAGPGRHEIVYTYVGTGDCVGEARTSIMVYPNPHIKTAISDPVYLCPGSVFEFNNSVSGGTSPYDYSWDRDVDPLSNVHILNPKFTSVIPGTYNLRLTVSDKNHCSARRSRNILVSDIDIAFDIKELKLCEGSKNQINTNISGGSGSYNYFWSGDVAYLSGPSSKPWFNAVDTGWFKLYCRVVDDRGCEMNDSVLIRVNEMPDPDILGDDINVCGYEVSVLTLSGVGATSWHKISGPGNVSFMTVRKDSTIIKVDKAGMYTLRFIETLGDCSASDEVTIYFRANPEPLAGVDAEICGDRIIVEARPDIGTGGWHVASGPGTLSFDDQFNDRTGVEVKDYGEYALVWREDNGGCVGTDTVHITFNQIPEPEFDMVYSGQCSPLDVKFNNNTIGGDDYLWHFQGASYSNQENPLYTFDLPNDDDTTFVVELDVTSAEGCKASIAKSIKVNPNPLAKINTSYKPICSPAVITLENGSVGANSYQWDFGDATSISLSDKSPVSHTYINKLANNQVKSYLVNLVAENSFGCTDTASTYMMVYPEANYKFNFSGNPICESSNVLITADGGAKEYKWDFGNGTLASGANPTVFAEYHNDGVVDTSFNVSLDASSYFGCKSSYLDSLKVHPVVIADYIKTEFEYAGSLDLTLMDASKNGEKVFIKWGDGQEESLNVSTGFPVTHTYENKDYFPKLFNITYIVQSDMGCEDSTGFQVRVYPEFIVDFDMPSEGCSPVEVRFNNQSTPAGTFEWDFGDGSPQESRLFPMHTFENLKTNGEPDTFIVRLTGVSMWGFADTIFKTLVVFPVPEAMWNITATNKPDDIVYIDNVSDGGDVYYWDLDDGDLDTSYVLSQKTKSFGNINPEQIVKHVGLKVENIYGCVDSIDDNITVNPIIIADFEVDSVACSPMSTVAISTSTGAVYYEWSLDGAAFVRGDVRFPVEIENNSNVAHYHSLTLKVKSVYGDEDIVTKTLTVYPVPSARMSGVTQNASPFNITLENLSNGGDQYLWVFGEEDSLLKTSAADASHMFVNSTQIPETKTVGLFAINNYGCKDSTSEMVIVYPEVEAGFDCPKEGCPPFQVEFKDTSVGGLFYEWTIEGVNTFYGRLLSYEFKNETLKDKYYRVHLKVESAYGYSDTTSKVIRIKPMVKSVFDVTTGGLSPFVSQMDNRSINALESSWSYGDGSTLEVVSGSSSTSHLYTASGAPEAFDVALTVVSPEGCYDSSLTSVMVYPDLKVDFNCDTIGCAPFDVTFENISVGVDLYVWDFGDGSSNWMSRDAFHRFVNNGDVPKSYQVRLIGQSKYGFKDTLQKTIVVNPTPKAFFDVTPEGDSPMEALFIDRSEGAVSALWNIDSGVTLLDPGIRFMHTYVNSSGAPLSKKVVQNVINSYGCHDSVSQTVNVFPNIKASFECDSLGCSPLTVSFNNTSHGALRYKWNFGDGSDSQESSRPVHVFKNSYADSIVNYKVSMIAYSQFGYSDTTYKIITVYPVPVVDYVIDKQQGCAPLGVEIENNSLGWTSALWQVGDETFIENDPKFSLSLTNESFLPKYVEMQLEVSNAYGCKSDMRGIVEVYPQVQASFDGDSVGCSPLTAIYMNMSRNANDYVWYVDGIADYRMNPVLPFENLNPDVERHTIKLLAKSAYGCSDSIVRHLDISPEPVLDFVLNPNEGFSPLKVVIENNSYNAEKYIWDLGEGDTVAMYDASPIEYTYHNKTLAPSVRKVTLVGENNYGCRSELSQSVDVYPIVEARFGSTGDGCSPLSVDFKNLSVGATHFEWDFGDGTPVSVASNPTHTFTNESLNYVKRYRVTLRSFSQFGFVDSAMHVVEVYPTPRSGFDVNIISGCSPVDLVITNECEGNGVMEWDFGLGEIVESEDSIFRKSYENVGSQPNYYNLAVNISNEYGCSNRTQKALEVLPGVVAKFQSDTAGCSPLTLVFRNSSQNATQYLWDLGDGTTTMDATPIKKYVNKTSEDFRSEVVLVARTSYGCTDTFKQKIAVYPEPDFAFEVLPAEVTLPSAEITINATLKNKGPWKFVWDFGDGDVSESVSPGAHSYDSFGEYNIKVNITDDRCSDVQYKGVVVNPSVPIAEFSAPAAGCTPVTMAFENRSQGMVASLWDFGDGTLSSDENPSHTYYREGNFDVKLTVFNDVGHADTLVRRVSIFDGVKADFLMTPHVVHSFAQPIQFSNFTQNGSNYIWEFGDGDVSHDFEPIKRYTKEGTFDIRLIAISKDGCMDTMVQKSALEVSDVYNVRFPNVFMPLKSANEGGAFSDGDTHVFYPLIDQSMLKEYRLMIFDRWGLMLFETTDVNRGWDGFYNGKMCQQGVYVWKVHAVFEDGNEVVETGDVTLLK